MSLLKKFLYPFFMALIGVIFMMPFFVSATNTNDRLSDAFDRSHKAWQNPYSSDVEADDLFNTNLSLTIWSWDGLWLDDSVIVRLARFLMRFAIVFAIPMILYSAIRIAIAFGDESKFQETLKHLGWVLGGVVLVLSSVALILLISSLWRSTLSIFSAWI